MKLEKTMPTPQLTWTDQFFRSQILKKVGNLRSGRIKIIEVFSGSERGFSLGTDSAPAELTATLRILNPRAYGKIALGGSIGAGESFTAGDWDSPDLVSLIRIFARNRDLLMQVDSGLGALLAPVQRWFHRLRRNSIEGSEKNIREHYDLGNDFFELFLDQTWMYSSAYFSDPSMTLQQGQVEKIDRICRRLNLKPGDHVVEIGTGWGGFALHAAKNYGCRVTTTTISKEQHRLAVERVREAGLSDQVEVLFKDYRLLEGQYDSLVSIEMIEAVGLEFLETYFETCNRLLKPGGQMVIQAITIKDQNFEHAKKNVDFIQRYIFPGSGIPSIESMIRATSAKTHLQLAHLEDFGLHYARTLNEWSKTLHLNRFQVTERGYAEELYRMWQFYFSYCEGAFLERAIGVSHLHFLKPE
jgi:cyclopropane-fatty-acyl-phospholipid synthase